MTEQPSQTDKARDPPPPTTPQTKRSDVEIKNGKVVFRQKPMSFEKMTETMQEMVSFREWLESRAQHQESPLTQIPESYWPLVAKFTHESDKTISALSKHIQQELAPDDEDDINCSASILPLSVIEDVVKLLASRINYGIESSLTKTPAALCVWRWELKQEYLGFLPKVSREKVDARRLDRIQYKKDLQTIFEALPDGEKNTLLGLKGHLASPPKAQPLARVSSNEATSAVVDAPDDQLSERTTNHGSDENRMAIPKAGRPKAAVDPGKAVEKAAKEKERTDKKVAKAEKERKDKESQEKARSIMASFFGKPKPSTTSTSSPKVHAPSATTTLSEFDRVFKPFTLKKGVELAPTNWFQDAKRRKQFADADVIVIDDDGTASGDRDIEMIEPEPSPDANTRQYLCYVLSSCPSLPTGVCSLDTVRSLMAQLSEAEVSDDTAAVRALLSKLQDRTRIPAKVLIFHEDERPGYFGTFTKRSRLVKPCRPFARDHIAIDYSYDSGAEWGEEDEGGGDDVLGDSDDERDDEEESDDLDGWLVDGDDEEAVTPIEEREGLDAFPFPPLAEGSKSKRKVGKEKETDTEGKAKKRKVVPLVPFVKGPCWETAVGDCEYDPFNQYRIQLFNDTPYPIDPFTFVSAPVCARNAPGPSTASSSGTKHQPQFVMPALPPHVLNPNTPPSEPAASNSASGQQPQAKRPRAAPKNPFPDDHLPFLKEKVSSMGTSSLIALVEALHLDLKNHRVKKNAIEAKLREICVKDQRHIWSVKADIEAPSLEVSGPR